MRIPAATSTIPTPPDMSKYFRNSITFSFRASALVPRFDPNRLPGKQHAEYFAENQFFHQQCDRQREDHSCDDRHCCDCELHYVLLLSSSQLLLPAAGWGHRSRCSLGYCRNARLRYTAEYLGDLLIPLAANLHCVSHAHHAEELLDIAIAHAKAAVGSGLANRPRLVGSVNPVPFLVETHPARTDRVV